METGFENLKHSLIKLIDEASTIEGISGCPCSELLEKLENNRFNLVVVGQFKRGKTTFINALLGDNILPTAVVPLTSIVTVIEYGTETEVTVIFNDGNRKQVPVQDLPYYVTEKGNPHNEKDVFEVIIKYPSEYLKGGVRLIDTPGVGSVYKHNTDVAYEYLPRSDATVFLISVDQPLSEAEIKFLKDVKGYSEKIFFLQNKADYLSADELKESLDFVRKTLLDEVGFDSPELYYISAKNALEGKLKNNPSLLQSSNLPDFEKRLKRFLLDEKGMILIRSVTGNLLRIISEGILNLEIRLKAINEPIEEMEKKLAAFREKKAEIESEKRDFDILLEGETNRIISDILDPDLEAAKAELKETLLPEYDYFYEKNKSLSPKKLRKSLETFIKEKVQEYYTIFRKNEDTRISLAFEKLTTRFHTKVNATVDNLFRYSSDLFDLKFETTNGTSSWSMESSFYFKFKDEPLMIEMLGDALTSLMPRFVSNRIIRKNMREYMLEMIERQSGRIRWDFVDRLRKSRLEFRWEMYDRIDKTIRGIEGAVRKGIEIRKRSKEEAAQAEELVSKELSRLKELKDEVTSIRGAAEKPVEIK